MSFLLRAMGWNPQPLLPADVDSFEELSDKPCVFIFSHTAMFWDCYFYSLYYKILRWKDGKSPIFLTFLDIPVFGKIANCISIKKIREAGQEGDQKSVIDELCSEVNRQRANHIIISPAGHPNIKKAWKSGYFHIAKRLGWGVRTFGFDYCKKRLVIGEYNDLTSVENREDIEDELQMQMADIVPLRRENYYVSCSSCECDKTNTSVITTWQIIIIVTVALFAAFLLAYLFYRYYSYSFYWP